MAMMSGIEMPLFALRSQVASAIDLVVQTLRMPDGGRHISPRLAEILPLNERGEYQLSDTSGPVGLSLPNWAKPGRGPGSYGGLGKTATFADQISIHGLNSIRLELPRKLLGLQSREGAEVQAVGNH